jgi:NAD(P)-dependent dehydrogenase (short-subunit alcohol dehydrogenase family)
MIDMAKWERIASENVKTRSPGPGRLGGKVAIVTGSAQGFGRGIAEELCREGARVVIADLNEPLAKTVAEALGERAPAGEGGRIQRGERRRHDRRVRGDVRRTGPVCLQRGRVKGGSLDEMEKKDFEFVTSINYTAFFTCVKYAQRIMRAQYEADNGWTGDIIEINSKSGLEGSNKNFAYAGGKFGGIGLVQSFALELAPHHIKVNAVCPGNYYDGPLWSDPERGLFVQYLHAGKVPGAKTVEDVKNYYLSKPLIKRGCLPADVAKAIFYAVEQTYETGQAIPVTGGQVMLR